MSSHIPSKNFCPSSALLLLCCVTFHSAIFLFLIACSTSVLRAVQLFVYTASRPDLELPPFIPPHPSTNQRLSL